MILAPNGPNGPTNRRGVSVSLRRTSTVGRACGFGSTARGPIAAGYVRFPARSPGAIADADDRSRVVTGCFDGTLRFRDLVDEAEFSVGRLSGSENDDRGGRWPTGPDPCWNDSSCRRCPRAFALSISFDVSASWRNRSDGWGRKRLSAKRLGNPAPTPGYCFCQWPAPGRRLPIGRR